MHKPQLITVNSASNSFSVTNGTITLTAAADSAVLTTPPTGNVLDAIATVGYINTLQGVMGDINWSSDGNTVSTTNSSATVSAAAFNATSDYRIKKDVIPITDTVDYLNPVTYINLKTCKKDFGLIAHELQEIYPFLVNGEKDAETYQSVNYIGLIALLIKEIKDLKKQIKIINSKLSL